MFGITNPSLVVQVEGLFVLGYALENLDYKSKNQDLLAAASEWGSRIRTFLEYSFPCILLNEKPNSIIEIHENNFLFHPSLKHRRSNGGGPSDFSLCDLLKPYIRTSEDGSK